MNASKLKQLYIENNPEGFYFDRKSMRFFGDTMSNYTVSIKPVNIVNYRLGVTPCYELRRKDKVKFGLKDSKFFCTKTFKIILGDVVIDA